MTAARPGEPDTATPPPAVSVRGVDMTFESTHAVREASFDLAPGRFLTILGPSGSGKSTLLRLVAGFLAPTRGAVEVGGTPVRRLPAQKRAIGMVFQRLALFPHMTAAENVAFPLRMRRFDARTIPERVARYLSLVRLDGLGDRRIEALSGGQQQRVAIARALVFEPDLLLLDEPLAALDRHLREEMQLEFRRIQRELGVTTINVTHDQREALVMSDDVIVMDAGRIQQKADPAGIYRAPANAFVAGFVGVSSRVPGTLGPATATGASLNAGTAACAGVPADPGLDEGDPAEGAIRAEQIRLADTPEALAGCDTRLAGEIADAIFEGDRLLYEVRVPALDGAVLRVYHHDPARHVVRRPGETVHLGWTAADMRIFAAAPR